jgi:hypothetical protein
MPSKSDLQFGKIVVANHMATKEEVETGLKSQAQFERERHTIILEGILLSKECLSLDQVEAIQKKMERRVIFCDKCHGKFNVFQFRGGERFLCHKCGNKVIVPDREQYREILTKLASTTGAFLTGEPEEEPQDGERPQRETIMLRKEDIERAKEPEDDFLEPIDEEVEGAIEEEVVEGEIVEEGETAPEPDLLPVDDGATDTPADGQAAAPSKERGLKRKMKKGKKKPAKGKGEETEKPKKGKLKKKKGPRADRPRLRRKR